MLLLAVTYPLLVHVAVLWPMAWLEWLALVVLCALVLFPHLQTYRRWAWVIFVAAGAGVSGLAAAGGARWLLLLPPVAIPVSLIMVFGGSLRAGQIPLVTRMAKLARDELPADLERYTRALTVFWTAVFALLALSAVGLALFASRELWSLATNFIHYLVIGVVFIAEYLYRRWRFRHHEHPTFRAYLRLLAPGRLRAS
jgi:uncharacterized membrane protein